MRFLSWVFMGLFSGCSYSPASSSAISLCGSVPKVLFDLGLMGVYGFVSCSYSSFPSSSNMGLCGFVPGICFLFGFGWSRE